MPATDWHSHFIPPSFADLLRGRTERPRIFTGAQGEIIDAFRAPEPYDAAGLSDADARVRSLKEAGIDRQVLCWPGLDSLPAALAVELAQAYNDSLSVFIRRYSARFAGFAALPLADPEAAGRELGRAHRELGLIGAVLPSEAFFSFETAQALRPVLEVAQARRSHLFVHPRFVAPAGEPELLPSGIDHRGARLGGLEVQARLTQAFFTLAFTDLLAPYPDVIVHLANLGGSVPFLAERMEIGAERNGLGPVFERLKRMYVDTANMGPLAIRHAVSILGVDRILFGTDQPGSTPLRTWEQISASPITAAEKYRILDNPAGVPGRW